MAALNFPASPVNGARYSANGKTWVYDSATTSWLAQAGTAPSVWSGVTPPSDPVTYPLWFKSDEGSLKVYYDAFWVDAFSAIPATAHVVNGRLTLISSTPITTTDVIGATSLYFTPCRGNTITLWDGVAWVYVPFNEITLLLGTLVTAKNYDVFAYLSGGVCVLDTPLVWTNDTTRATAVTLQDGRYCKSGDKTRLYLGTFRTTSTTTTEDSGGGTTTQVGGKRFLWNYYNRVSRALTVFDSTDTWNYTTVVVRQANGAAGNKVEYVCGIAEDMTDAQATSNANLYSNTTDGASTGVGVDSTTAYSGIRGAVFMQYTAACIFTWSGSYRGIPGIGYHYLAWLESGANPGNCTFIGDNGGAGSRAQSGMNATVQG